MPSQCWSKSHRTSRLTLMLLEGTVEQRICTRRTVFNILQQVVDVLFEEACIRLRDICVAQHAL